MYIPPQTYTYGINLLKHAYKAKRNMGSSWPRRVNQGALMVLLTVKSKCRHMYYTNICGLGVKEETWCEASQLQADLSFLGTKRHWSLSRREK